MEIQEVPAPASIKHGTLSAFRHRNFRLFYTGQTISLIGTWSQSLALSWLVWRITESGIWLGISNFVIQFPMLIFGLPGGWAADRFDRLRILSFMQVLCMLQAIALAALTLTDKIQLWHVLVLSVMLGTIYAFEFPVRQAFVMDMVGKRHLLNAVSLNAAMIHATRMAGPTAAGFIVAWKGEGICFLFNAATFIALIAALAMINRREIVPLNNLPHEPMDDAIRTGLHFIRKEPRVKIALVLVGFVSVVGMPFIAILPMFADNVYGGGAVQLGWLMGISGGGAVLGALWLAGRKKKDRLLELAARAATFFSAALVAFSLFTDIYYALLAIGVVGFFLTIHFSCISTLIQECAPDHLRGRAMSIFTMFAMGLGPFGALLGGFMAHHIGAPLTVTITGTACFLIGVIGWVGAKGRKS